MSARGMVASQNLGSGPSCIMCVYQPPLHVLDEQEQGKLRGNAYTLPRHAGPASSCSDLPDEFCAMET